MFFVTILIFISILIGNFYFLTNKLNVNLNLFQDKLNICKRKIKEFIIKTNSERLYLKNSIFDIEDNISNNYRDFIINLIIIKFPSANNNFKIDINNPNIIYLKYYNYSLLFSLNIINDFSNKNDIYPIYYTYSSHILHKRLYNNENKENDNNEITNPSILYKINSYNELCNFIQNYNYKNSRYIYIELILYNITIDLISKRYNTIKTIFYIKKNILDVNQKFLNLFKLLNNKNNDFKIIDKSNLIIKDENQEFEISNYYDNKTSFIDSPLEYTHMTIDEYNDFYF